MSDGMSGGDGSPQLDLDAIEARIADGSAKAAARGEIEISPGIVPDLIAEVRRLQQENKELRAPHDAYTIDGEPVLPRGWMPVDGGRLAELEASESENDALRGRVEELTEALRAIRRVLNDDGDGAGPGAMFSMIDRHLEAAGFLT